MECNMKAGSDRPWRYQDNYKSQVSLPLENGAQRLNVWCINMKEDRNVCQVGEKTAWPRSFFSPIKKITRCIGGEVFRERFHML